MDSRKESNFISAVVYMHNEEKRVNQFITSLVDVLSVHFQKYEIICVNDASTDKGILQLKEFSDTYTQSAISVINMSYYHGLENAMKAGIDLAIGDFVYEFDSMDMNYEKELIYKIYEQSLCGFDIVNAVAKGKSSFSSRLFYKLFNANSKSIYSLQTETFRILSRRGINRVQSMSKNVPYRKALYASCGLKLYHYEYNPVNNLKGQVQEAQTERVELAVNSLILFTNLTYKIALAITTFFLATSMGALIYVLAIFLNGKPIEGWTTMMLFMSFSFFGIFLIFVIMIKYLSILTELVFKQKDYLVQSVEKY